MKKGTTKGFKFSPDKLREELRRRGLNQTAVSRELGYSDAYISYALNSGVMGMPAVNQLKMRYNIDPELLKEDATVEKSEEEPKKVEEPTGEDLKAEVAALTASVKELKEEFRNYRVAMLGYMKKFENHKKYGHF